MKTTLPDNPANSFNDWIEYIYKQLGYTNRPIKSISDPKSLSEWLDYIRKERNRPCR